MTPPPAATLCAMSPRIGSALVATALLALALAGPSPARTGPVASASALRNCKLSVSDEQHLGATYVYSLKVAHTTCARGKSVVRAFQKCRRAHGGARGRCPRTTSVLGYHCTEKRGGVPTQFEGTVTCRSGTRRVVHQYSQNT